MKTNWLFDTVFIAVLTGLSFFAPVPSTTVLVLMIGVLSLSLLPAMSREVPPGHLRRDRILILLGLFLLAMSVRLQTPGGASLWWALASAGLLVVLGGINTLNDHRQKLPWSRRRREMALTALVLLAASSLVGAAARGVLAFRSTMAIPPGSLDFLISMAIWAGAWFGFDSGMRRPATDSASGRAGWLWDRRYSLGLILVCGIIYVREGLS